MNLNLWAVNDWLREYDTKINCTSPKQEFSGIRLYQPGQEIVPYALYIGRSDDFFHDGGRNVVCRGGSDTLTMETEDLTDVVNRVQDAFSYYSRWYDSCLNAISEGCSLSGLVSFAPAVFDTPLMIVNAAQILLAQSGDLTGVETPEDLTDLEKNSSLSGEKLMEFNRRFSKSFYESDIFSIPRGFFPTQSLCKHIFSDDGARLGTAILKMPEEEEGDYQRLPYSQRFFLECFVGLVEKWVHDSPESKNSFRLTSYFVSALLGNADALPVMERQLTLFGWGENCRKQVLVICAPRGSSNFSMRFTRELSGEDLHVFVIPFENRLVVLCDLDRLPGAFFGRLRELLTGSGYCASASLPFTDLKFFDRSYKQAMTVLKYSPQVPGTLYRCQDVAMFVTARTVRDNLSTSLAHPALTFFKNYDAENGTEYYRTLFTYLVCERRNQQTAQALHIHRNTLILRMEKIRDLWPLDLDDANERFFLLFSFYLYGMDDPAGPGLPGYSLSTAGPGLPAS